MLSMTLKRLRKNCGFSQQQVADSLNIDRSTYSYYEIGKTTPDVNTIIKLSKIFDVPYTEIFEEEETSAYVFNDCGYGIDDYLNSSKPKVTERVYELSKDEKSLLCFFRTMDKEEQQELLENLLKNEKKNNKKDLLE